MQQKQIHQSDGQRTYVVVLKTGEEVMECLSRFAAAEKVGAAQLTGIGAFQNVVLMYFDWQKKEYLRIPVREQVEVASLIGDIAEGPDGKPSLHVHLVVGKRDGTAMAGHLAEAHVRPRRKLNAALSRASAILLVDGGSLLSWRTAATMRRPPSNSWRSSSPCRNSTLLIATDCVPNWRR